MNTTFTECIAVIPQGMFNTGVRVGATTITVIDYCISTCENCSLIASNCTVCNTTQNRYLVNNSCIPNIGYYENNGTDIALPCDPNCL
jgi:hypothetical protein